MDGGAKTREFSGKSFQHSGKHLQFHMIVAADIEGKELFMASKAASCGIGGFQDQFRVRQKLYSLCGERHAFAGASEQFNAQLSFQSADLVADCRLSDPQDF